ncbi:MAG: hypothetical protein JNL08_19155 [Planctomycetes bacterium]|nr:hypothetical protein [Planctomycetota bacterium]
MRRALGLLMLLLSSLGAGGCLGIQQLDRAQRDRLRAFDFYWQALANEYPLFGQQQVPWQELRHRYRAAVPYAEEPHEFHHLLSGLFSELGDVHVSYSVPPERWLDRGRAPVSLLDLDGFRLMPVEGRLHVVGWPDGQAPPQPDGLPPAARYPELWRVEGFPVVVSLVANLLRGPPGTPVELQLRWRDGTITRHVLRRPASGSDRNDGPPLGHLDRGHFAWRPHRRRDRSLRWIEVASFGERLVVADVVAAIQRGQQRSGLVLDLRHNLGGQWAVTQALIEHFLPEPIDFVFVQPQEVTMWAGLVTVEVFARSTWLPRPPLFDGPLVVLTSSLTASMAEHAARVLQRHCGAIVIGERTVGAEAGLREFAGPDGGVLKFGAQRVVDRTGVGLQAEGVVPDIAVRLRLDDLERLGPDAAARDWDERLAAAAQAALAARREQGVDR